LKETRIRSLIKTIVWRLIATLNSFLVLLVFGGTFGSCIKNAIIMNVTGFFVYYIYERVWTTISYGTYDNERR
jgi:uncharacterized membrane protein